MTSEQNHIHFTYPLEDDERAILNQHLETPVLITDGDAIPTPATYHLLVDGRPTRAQLEASPNLRVVLIPFAGLPPTTRDLMAEYPHIAVHNIHHNAEIVAEFAFGLLLAAAKNIVRGDAMLRENDWSLRYETARSGTMLRGKTALILGYGAIGTLVAGYCRAFGMRVLAIKRTVPHDAPNYLHPITALHDVLPQAHVVIVALPHTPATEGLLGAHELSLLPPRAILVNVGRASVVDEVALYAALQSGRLLAAASDVWYQYPKSEAERINTAPANQPFATLPNMILSPHRSGHVDETEALRLQYVAHTINAFVRGAELPHRVNLDAGY